MPDDPTDPEPSVAAAAAPGQQRPLRLSAARGLGLFGLYLAAQLIVGILVGFGIGIRHVLAGGDPNDAEALAEVIRGSQGATGVVSSILGGLGFVALVLSLYSGPRGASFREASGLAATTPRRIATGAGWGMVVGATYFLLCVLLWPPSPDMTPGPTTQMAVSPGAQRQLWMFAALLGSPPLEEFVFRGLLLAFVLASWGTTWATIVTTGLFVGMHFSEFAAYWPAAFGLAALSLTATRLRVRSGSLVPAVAAHFGYNLVMVLLVVIGSTLARSP